MLNQKQRSDKSDKRIDIYASPKKKRLRASGPHGI